VTITTISAPKDRRGGRNVAEQAATLSTASAELNVTVDLVRLSSGTATTYYYVLPTSTGGDWPVAGQNIMIIATGTGVNSLWISGTATGRLEFDQDKFVACQYWAGHWYVLNTSATISSAS